MLPSARAAEGNPTSGSSAQPGTPLAISAARRATLAHYASAKGISITTADQGQDFAFLSTLGSHPSACLCLPISIIGKVVDFKVDTGAEVTAITPSTYNLFSALNLDKPCSHSEVQTRSPFQPWM